MKEKRKAHNSVNIQQRETKVLFQTYIFGANKRGISFNLTLPFFQNMILQPCTYCGNLAGNKKTTIKGIFKYNGIDRWDNKIGYEEDNCLPCCGKCNKMKGASTDGSDFIEHIKKIIDKHSIDFNMTEKKLHKYNLRLEAIKQNSPDEETKVAAILIDPKTGAVNAEGYNGFVRGAPDHILPKTRPDKYPYMIHAEANVIYNSVRSGVGTDGKILFCSLSPCLNCCRFLYQCGIKTIYFKEKYRDFDNQLNALDIDLSVIPYYQYYKLTLSPQGE